MKLFSYSLFLPALALIACGGAIIPVAENNGDLDAGHPGNDAQATNPTNPKGVGGGGGGGGGEMNLDGGVNGPMDGGSAACMGDGALANNCLCGPVICIDGEWGCGSCVPDDAGPSGCNPGCAPGSVCVRDQMLGGPMSVPDDAGNCPGGSHANGNQCVGDPSYSCAPSPVSCNGAYTCGCAAALCTQQADKSCPFHCVGTSASEIDCECDAP